MKNYILEYYEKIQSGEIVAGRRIKQQYKKLVDDINNPKDPYIFDLARANEPIEFIEEFCYQSDGSNAGTPLRLELFQKAKFQAIFGFIDKDTGFRRYNEVMTIEGRKNGKTTENSALALYMLVGDGEGNAKCFFIATKKEQADIAFDEAHNMVKQNPHLSKYVRKTQTALYFGPTFGEIKSLPGDAKSLDGLNAHFVTIDEMHEMKSRRLYDDMQQSISARDQPLISIISTNGLVRDGIFDDQYKYACQILDGEVENEGFLAFLYELDKRDEWEDPEMWMKANPGLGTIKKYKSLEANVNRGKVDHKYRKTLLTKDFNLNETGATAWLSNEVLENKETFDISKLGFRYGIGGIDLSETTDLTAAVMLMQRPNDDIIYVESMFWLPAHKIEERTREDKIPYDVFVERGLLRPSGDHKIDPQDVLNWFEEMQEDYDVWVSYIGYDRWGMKPELPHFMARFGKRTMIPIAQGPQTQSRPLKELEGDLEAKLINYNDNPLMKMCLANAEVRVDNNNNFKLDKGMDRRKRIDGADALLNAYITYGDNKDNYLALI